jgi:hypothetical protein
MIDTRKNKVPIIIAQIAEAEKRRAKRVMNDPAFQNRVAQIRQKYIVDGFLIPVYWSGGRLSHSKLRVSRYGNYILSSEMQGTEFLEGRPSWIRNEYTWFWIYLKEGQEVVSSNILLPEQYKIDGIPANLVWPEIIGLLKDLHIYGEEGGGAITLANDFDTNTLSSNHTPNVSGWMMLFDDYDTYRRSKMDFEIRPAWFHLAKYIFFNTPMQLPVFVAQLNAANKLEELKFLEKDISDEARSLIGKNLLSMPIRLRKMVAFVNRRETDEIVWWLWHNIGYPKKKYTLSYKVIAEIAGTSKSSVQTAVERFDKKIKGAMEPHLLGQLLRIAGNLGLGTNKTYNALAKKGLVPARKRGIDGFDDLDKLI